MNLKKSFDFTGNNFIMPQKKRIPCKTLCLIALPWVRTMHARFLTPLLTRK